MIRLIGFPISLAFVALNAGEIKAHDWYPYECCNGLDCAPVEEVQPLPEGLLVTSKYGTAIVPSTTEMRPSPDGRLHVCMRKDFEKDTMRVLCFFGAAGA